MGKRLIAQRRGKGGPNFLSPGHRFFGEIKYSGIPEGKKRGEVINLIDDVSRNAVICDVLLEDGSHFYNLAAEGLAIGDFIEVGREASPSIGSVLPLSRIPDGFPIFNLEKTKGDNGSLVRSGGTCAYIVAHNEETGLVDVRLPSKKVISLHPSCLATVGVECGGGRKELPFVKASTKRFAFTARGRYYPIVRGRAKCAYAHPYGGKTGGKPTTVSHHAPPGRKAGHIGATRTGRKKGKSRESMASTDLKG